MLGYHGFRVAFLVESIMHKTISQIGEDELVERILRNTRLKGISSEVLVPNGDDCAVFQSSPTKALVVSTDALVEKVHFSLDTITPWQLGNKALAVNLSDIAAMGASPKYYTVTLAASPSLSVDFTEKFYRGLSAMASHWNVLLLGGEIGRASCRERV